jgi:hypothetical protein
VKVVPACYESQYRELLTAFDFIGAELLKVSLRSSKFNQFKAKENIKEEKITISNPDRKDAKLIDIDYYKINKEYFADTGLNFDIDAFNASTNVDFGA